MSDFRSRTIHVSSGVYEGLKAMADLEGLDCPDAWADLSLGQLLSEKADLAWLLARRRADREKLKADYTEHLKNP